MIPDFELDSYGRKVFPVKSYLIREDLAVRVDLKTLVALAAEHNAPHFVIRDVNGDGGNQDIVKRVWSLHFTHIPSAGLVIAYVPPSGEEGEAATKPAEYHPNSLLRAQPLIHRDRDAAGVEAAPSSIEVRA